MAAAAVAALAVGGAAHAAGAAVMVQPKDAVILESGPGEGLIVNTYNQAGLAPGYIDEVTLSAPYVAVATHTNVFACCEWFGEPETTTASVAYLTAPRRVKYIESFHLWNEESSGIGKFDLWWGTFPGDRLMLVIAGGMPTDNPLGPPYLADNWYFSPKPSTAWWTLDMWDCPQPDPGSFPSCAIGEVAFNGIAIPEPGTWAMLIAGFGLVGTAVRRRREALA
jgi:hypothetical protein